MLTKIALGTVTQGTTGTAQGIQDLQNSYATISGTYSATWYVDISADGTNYAVFDSGSSDKLVGPIPAAMKVRLRVGGGSGSVIGALAGDDGAAGAVRTIPLGPVDDGEDGDATDISELDGAIAVVGGTFTGTWVLKLSFDAGETWHSFATNTTAAVVSALPRCGLAKIDLGAGSGSVECSIIGVCYEASRKRNADPGRIREGVNADITSQAYKTPVYAGDLQGAKVRLWSADFVGTYDVQVSMDGTHYASHTSAAVPSGATAVTVSLPRCVDFKVGASAYTGGTLSSAWSGSADRVG
jgi:hypothetical protein